MEDPESEWEIQEYSSSNEVESTKVKWILNKGFVIGVKMVITGMAISAAPLVLPPLVVCSAMGVAFSVPSGLVFATYACTNKLMRTLLPSPPSPALLEYYSYEDEQGKDEGVECKFEINDGGDGQIDVLEKGYYLDEYEDDELKRENMMQEEEEEEEQIGVIDEEVEDLATNVDTNVDEKGYFTDEEENVGENDEFRPNNVVEDEDGERMVDIVLELDEGGDNYRQEREALIANVDEKVHNTSEDEDEKQMEDDMLQREPVIEEELDEGGDNYRQEREALIANVDNKGYNTNENEDEKQMEDDLLQRETVIEEEEREQMEDIKQGVEVRLGLGVGSVTNDSSDGVDEQGYEEDVGEYIEGDDSSLGEEHKGDEMVESRTDTDENKNVTRDVTIDEQEDIAKGSTGLLEKMRDGCRVDNGDNVEDDFTVTVDESNLNENFEESKGVERTELVIVEEIETQKLVKDENKNNETIGVMHHVVILAQGNEGNNFNSREVEELDLVAREVVGDTNKDGRNTESDEEVMRESMGTREKTCADLSENGTRDANLRAEEECLIHSNVDAREIGDLDLFDDQNTSMNIESLEGGGEANENAADEDVDVLALPGFKRIALDTENAKVADAEMPSRKEVSDDEKIWEKLGAMRAIVGYKSPSQPTCIGELKALYVFTGVEPTASFEGDMNIDEVNAKLKFLMSIVGVK